MPKPLPLVVIGILGSTLDAVGGRGENRKQRWRPTVDLVRHPELPVARLELISSKHLRNLLQVTRKDIAELSPDTEVRSHELDFDDPWDFEEVYAKLFEWVRRYPFQSEREEYLVHITTGTHVAQICWFLLTESRHIPGRLLQASPSRREPREIGDYRVIDLDLGKYDGIARRFRSEQQAHLSFLKSGIDTKNAAFNRLIENIELVATRSSDPILLSGPTGAGKSDLARRIYELKRERRRIPGPFVEVNCATLRGDSAMSTLFGHIKGAFTGATHDRAGLLKSASNGMLFLDEIGELGLDEQAMLLRALEDKTFYPVGSDKPSHSDFELLAGTNRDLGQRVSEGRFREDLLARINLWSFRLPGLRERSEDIEPNLDFELARWEKKHGRRLTINREARERFLSFCCSKEALWLGNFRDFGAAITRMAVFAEAFRIDETVVEAEIARLKAAWQRESVATAEAPSKWSALVGDARWNSLDRFEQTQLADVLAICIAADSLSAAGRQLFAASRSKKTNPNDADRLRKYLNRYGLTFDELRRA